MLRQGQSGNAKSTRRLVRSIRDSSQRSTREPARSASGRYSRPFACRRWPASRILARVHPASQFLCRIRHSMSWEPARLRSGRPRIMWRMRMRSYGLVRDSPFRTRRRQALWSLGLARLVRLRARQQMRLLRTEAFSCHRCRGPKTVRIGQREG